MTTNKLFTSFVMCETTRSQIKALPEDMQLKFLWAVIDFGIDGIEPDFYGVEYALWIPMRDFILNSKQKDEAWHKRQQENGKKGGAPHGNGNAKKTTHNNPEQPSEEKTTHNVNDNVNDNDNINISPPVSTQDPPDDQSFPTAIAVDQKDPDILTVSGKEIVPASRSPPVKAKKTDLTPDQMTLYHAARTCFESDERTKAILYQDKGSTAREMQHIKLLVIRCTNIAPDISADFLRNVLEHFRVMCNGRLKGKAVFTPRALITPWIWELVINSLPETESPELREIIKGLFK